jgi:hypothetical protein
MHTGGSDTAPAFSGQRVYLQFTWEVGLPPSPVEFSSHCHFYKLSCSWLLGGATTPAFSIQLIYLQFHEGFPLPPLWCSGCPVLFAMCLFCYCLLFNFSFFPWVVSVCPGGYADLAQGCLWECCVLLSSPCGPHLPKLSGHCLLAAAREPSWFLCLTWSGDAMRRLGVLRSQSFASSWWFFL